MVVNLKKFSTNGEI